MPLRGIVFDLGGTILEYEGPRAWEWPGLEAFREALVRFGYDAPTTENLLDVHVRMIETFHARLEHDPSANLTQDDVFRAMLAEGGLTLTPDQWDAARARYYEASHAHIQLLPGVRETLDGLRVRGLLAAALSNTQWPDAELDRNLAGLGVKDDFAARFYSASQAAWKPWPTIFARALAALGLEPDEAAYVGDIPKYDVRGAKGAGMRAVWLNRKDLAPVDGLIPDATIGALPELLSVVDCWMGES